MAVATVEEEITCFRKIALNLMEKAIKVYSQILKNLLKNVRKGMSLVGLNLASKEKWTLNSRVSEI